MGFGGGKLGLRLFKLRLGLGDCGIVDRLVEFARHSGRQRTPMIALALFDGGLERAQTDLRRTQVRDLVDFQHGVHVGLVRQNLRYLVGGDGVETAAEGVELHEFQPRIGGHEVGRRIQAGMVGPLVGDAQRHLGDLAVADMPEAIGVLRARIVVAVGQEFAEAELLPRLQLADGVLGQDHHTQRADGFGDAVVDFRIDMVRAPGKHDAPAVVLLHVRQCAQTLLLHIMFEHLVFGVRGLDRRFGFLTGHVGPCELLDDTVDHQLMIGEIEIGTHVVHALLAQFGHVRADDHRVVRHDRAVVVVVGVGHKILLVAYARVEDGCDALVEQPLDMAVHQLGRVADVLGGDRFDARLEQFMRAAARNHDLEAQ